ncbi:hypothetical protein BD324DRAFT_640883 [Kockovaella imperatae]|uniref:Enoyl reductase (ER) domain-containing protein n=1 Tax=Kockovaella imperatae TaxID=4999 RepID=A0A1Y1UQ21_9TREE|nr:hypothetical protein BD324DRAFT_640883 [Kockovaella imperatae]ORX39667.1 hypothetical protein BD324DRAFT_640883 [Kockovaella imperatae]
MTGQIPKTMKAIQVDHTGGPEVNKLVEIPVPEPKDNEVLIKVHYTGVNFIDTYFRTGLYPKPTPYIVGQDAIGTLVTLPTSYTQPDHYPSNLPPLKVGTRVLTLQGPSFAEYMTVPLSKVVALPENVDPKDGVALATTSFTSWGLVTESYKVKKGDWVFIRAASGGVGTVLCQMCAHIGANIIAQTSTEEKAKLAKENGAQNVLLSTLSSEETVKKTMELTNGLGCQVIYDGIGKDTFEENFLLVRRLGTIALFGNASGPPPSFSPLKLSPKALKITRPQMNAMLETPEEFNDFAGHIFELYSKGAVKAYIHKTYPLTAEAVAQAQVDITSRGTTGKLIIEVAPF